MVKVLVSLSSYLNSLLGAVSASKQRKSYKLSLGYSFECMSASGNDTSTWLHLLILWLQGPFYVYVLSLEANSYSFVLTFLTLSWLSYSYFILFLKSCTMFLSLLFFFLIMPPITSPSISFPIMFFITQIIQALSSLSLIILPQFCMFLPCLQWEHREHEKKPPATSSPAYCLCSLCQGFAL